MSPLPPVPAAPPGLPVWACRLLAATLILGAAALHVGYMLHRCPLDLSPDEAHYWDWSRHLDWSYYSKGPLVAFLIRAGCAAVGPWSERHGAGLTFAVRLPAVVCGSLLLLSLYIQTVQVFRRETLALGVVALALTLPVIAAGAFLMTIDAPYTCCWGWALVLGHRAIFRASGWAWPAAGLAVGLGILAKYTMLLYLPSVGLFLLMQPDRRRLLLRPGFWVMSAVAGFCCLPILVWNLRNGWVTFRHVGGLAGEGLHWFGPLNYVGGQAALLLGYWFVVWAAAMVRRNPWAETDAGARYLWWLSAPMFLVFLGFSIKDGGGELNWPVTAYLSGLVLAADWLAGRLASPAGWRRRLAWAALALASVVGLAGTVVMHHTDWVQPLLLRLSGPEGPANRTPLRRFDPTCRLRGWRTLAAAVDRERVRVAFEEGRPPDLAASVWWVPGELGVYCAGHPQAYSIGLSAGDRHSQYDLWTNPLDNGDQFLGRTFLIVGDVPEEARRAFAEVEEPLPVEYREKGQLIMQWKVTVCRGFRGFTPPPGGWQAKKVY